MKINLKIFPFSPQKFPFFYGWIIVAAATLGTIASIPGQTMGVGVFSESLMEALNLTRTELSTAYMIGTILSSLILPFAGRVLDQIGVRLMGFFGSISMGFSLVLLSQSDKFVHLWELDPFIISMSVITVCFFFLRFFGQGTLTMVSRVAIGKWFNHRRGLATAISGVFVTFGFNFSPKLLNHLLNQFGWRYTCLIMALTIGLGMSLVAWFFYREEPEQFGLVMDGTTDEAKYKKLSGRIPETRKDFTRSEAIRTLPFWAFTFGFAVIALIITSATFHISSIGKDLGLSRSESYSIFMPISVFSIGANLFSSWISDRIQHKWLLLVMMFSLFFVLIGLDNLNRPLFRLILIPGYGIAVGTFVSLMTVVLPRFFGRRHLGAINGVSYSVTVFASAIGPALFSAVHNITGSYHVILLLTLILPAIVIVLGLKADNPQKSL